MNLRELEQGHSCSDNNKHLFVKYMTIFTRNKFGAFVRSWYLRKHEVHKYCETNSGLPVVRFSDSLKDGLWAVFPSEVILFAREKEPSVMLIISEPYRIIRS